MKCVDLQLVQDLLPSGIELPEIMQAMTTTVAERLWLRLGRSGH